jgi:transcriptional regulator with XRE-family HTH domain
MNGPYSAGTLNKLTAEQVARVRIALGRPYLCHTRELARRFGVSQSTINKIKAGKYKV